MTNRPPPASPGDEASLFAELQNAFLEGGIEPFVVAWQKWIHAMEVKTGSECAPDDALYVMVLTASCYLPGGLRVFADTAPQWKNGDGTRKSIAQFAGEWLNQVNPTLSTETWGTLFHLSVADRYGGTYVYFKRRPASSIEHDARKPLMTIERLRALHPDKSRSYLYKVLKGVRQKK